MSSQKKIEEAQAEIKRRGKRKKKEISYKHPLPSVGQELLARTYIKHLGDEKKAIAEVHAQEIAEIKERKPTHVPIPAKKRAKALLEEHPITNTNNLLGNQLPELLRATKDVHVKDGSVISIKDNQTRLEATKIALKLHELLDDNEGNKPQVNISVTDSESLQRIADNLARLNASMLASPIKGEVIDV